MIQRACKEGEEKKESGRREVWEEREKEEREIGEREEAEVASKTSITLDEWVR